jgi:ribonuclease T1
MTRIPPRIARIGALGALASALLLAGPAIAATPTAATVTATAPAASVSVQAVGSICYSALPTQAYDTLDLIASGGPFPYSQDGTVFRNAEGLLPSQTSGYYHEYTL